MGGNRAFWSGIRCGGCHVRCCAHAVAATLYDIHIPCQPLPQASPTAASATAGRSSSWALPRSGPTCAPSCSRWCRAAAPATTAAAAAGGPWCYWALAWAALWPLTMPHHTPRTLSAWCWWMHRWAAGGGRAEGWLTGAGRLAPCRAGQAGCGSTCAAAPVFLRTADVLYLTNLAPCTGLY